MTWTNKHLNLNNGGIDNDTLQVNGEEVKIVNVTMANGTSIIDGWGNTIGAGTSCTLWRKELNASFTNYDSLSSAWNGLSIVYYGISANNSGISIGTPYKNQTDYITYSNGVWSPSLDDAVYSNTTYTATYTMTYFHIIKVTCTNCSCGINSVDSNISVSESGSTTIYRVPCSLSSVTITYKASDGYAFDSSGTTSKTVTYDVSSQSTDTQSISPTYAYVTSPYKSTLSDAYGNSPSGWYALGSTFTCVYRVISNAVTRTETSSDSTYIHLVAECAFSGSSSSTTNQYVSKDVSGVVYKQRNITETTPTTLGAWFMNGSQVSTSSPYSFNVTQPCTITYTESTGSTTTTYGSWNYTGGSSFTLPSYSEISSRSYSKSSSVTFKWNSDSRLSNVKYGGSIISSPYSISGTETITYTPNTSMKWVSSSDNSSYDMGSTYTIPISRVTDGKLISLYLQTPSSSSSYSTITSPTATLYATTKTLYVSYQLWEPNNSSYISNETLYGSSFPVTQSHLCTSGLPSAYWQGTSSNVSLGTSTSVNNSTYTLSISDGAAGSISITLPTASDFSSKYGYFVGCFTSQNIYSNVSGTQSISSDKTYYIGVGASTRSVVIYNNTSGTLTIDGTSVTRGNSITKTVCAGTTSSWTITSSSTPALIRCIAACESSSSTKNSYVFSYGVYASGSITRTSSDLKVYCEKYDFAGTTTREIYINTIFTSDYS